MRFVTPGLHGLSPKARELLDAYERAGIPERWEFAPVEERAPRVAEPVKGEER